MHDLMPLCSLLTGQTARIAEVLGGAELVHRLHELGLRSGAEVAMVQPGAPCIIRLAGQKLCFRADELTSVLVRTGAGP